MFKPQQPAGTARGAHRYDTPGRLAANVVTFSASIITLGVIGIGAMKLNPAWTTEAIERLSASWVHFGTTQLPTARPSAELQRTPALAQSVPAAPAAPDAAEPPAGGDAIAVGDRLKITFFESVAVALGGAAQDPAAPAPVTIFPRMDLSGEYVVDEAGGLDIPRLGWHAVTGGGDGTLERQLASAFSRAFGRPCDVHVAVLDRRPVYILGGLRGGMAIKHAPGMTALQALAEAGGQPRDVMDTSRAIEAIRETQRLGEAQDRLARAVIRLARLTAMRDGGATTALPPAMAALLSDTPPQDTAALLHEADTALTLERSAHAERLALANRQVDIAGMELAAQSLRATQARVISESKTLRLRGMEGIAAQGSVSQFKVLDIKIELAEAVARQEDLRVAIAQAQSRLTEAETGLINVTQAFTRQVMLEVGAAAQEVADLRRAVRAMREVVAVLDEGSGRASRREAGPPSLTIVRQGPGGTLLIPAFQTTPLLPGDVLQIGQSSGPVKPIDPATHF